MKEKILAIGKIIQGILAILGVMFIVLLLWPDEEVSGTVSSDHAADLEEAAPVTGHPDTEDHSGDGAYAVHMSSIGESTDAQHISMGNDEESATVMIYMNGSDLESEAGEATMDISEMLDSGIGEKVNAHLADDCPDGQCPVPSARRRECSSCR